MAIHGLSLAENERYILKSDPAHPDNIKAEYTRRSLTAQSQEEKDEILAKIEAEAGKPTVFLLGNLLHEDRVYLGDLSGGMEQTTQGTFRMTPKNNQKASETVRRALRGWENFTDANGAVLTFSTAPGVGERGQPRSFASPASMSVLHLEIVRELSARVLEVNGVTGDVEKKLLSALQAESEQLSPDGLAAVVQTATKSNEAAGSQVSEGATGN